MKRGTIAYHILCDPDTDFAHDIIFSSGPELILQFFQSVILSDSQVKFAPKTTVNGKGKVPELLHKYW